jgi:glycosyltransferase involved in cell wall biosynthesis
MKVFSGDAVEGQKESPGLLYVNGRILGQPPNGVQRYAMEILRQWDRLLSAGEIDAAHHEIVVLTPPGEAGNQQFQNIRIQAVGRLRGNLWEQIDLPRYVAGKLLFNPCNSGPWIKPGSQIVTIHDASVFAVPYAYSLPYRLKHRLLYRRFADTAKTIITVSEFSKKELIRWCNIPSERIKVIYSGCEHILSEPADRGILRRERVGQRPYVFAVGSHSAHKNVAAVLELADMLDRMGHDLVIAGGSYARVFRAVHYQTPASVHWLGFVTNAELRALYEQASLFVFPSLYEGFGFPPLEAMACGCPVLLSRAASLPELGGESALYCDPSDPRTLASGVRAILGDAELRSRLVKAGHERAKEFTWLKSARETWRAMV